MKYSYGYMVQYTPSLSTVLVLMIQILHDLMTKALGIIVVHYL